MSGVVRLGLPLSFLDLEAADPALFHSLSQLLETPMAALGLEPDSLTFTFTTTTSDTNTSDASSGSAERELTAGGGRISVTDENKFDYARLLASHRLSAAFKPQVRLTCSDVTSRD